MKLTYEQYAQALWEAVVQSAEKDHGLIFERFLQVLKQNNDIELWDKIENQFHKLALKDKGIHIAELMTARPLELKKTDLDALNELAGKKLQMEKSVDQDLVGGVVLRVDDTLIDASIANQMQKLADELKK